MKFEAGSGNDFFVDAERERIHSTTFDRRPAYDVDVALDLVKKIENPCGGLFENERSTTISFLFNVTVVGLPPRLAIGEPSRLCGCEPQNNITWFSDSARYLSMNLSVVMMAPVWQRRSRSRDCCQVALLRLADPIDGYDFDAIIVSPDDALAITTPRDGA